MMHDHSQLRAASLSTILSSVGATEPNADISILYAHYFYYAIIRYSSLTTPIHVETKWRLRVAALVAAATDLLEGEGRDEEMKKREGEERRLTHTDTFCRA